LFCPLSSLSQLQHVVVGRNWVAFVHNPLGHLPAINQRGQFAPLRVWRHGGGVCGMASARLPGDAVVRPLGRGSRISCECACSSALSQRIVFRMEPKEVQWCVCVLQDPPTQRSSWASNCEEHLCLPPCHRVSSVEQHSERRIRGVQPIVLTPEYVET
jgi:hypothetical protein